MNWYNRTKIKLSQRPRREWSEEELNDMGDFMRSGIPIAEIARYFSTSERNINGLNDKYKWRSGKSNLVIDDKMKEEIRRLHVDERLNPIEISKIIGISAETIYNHLLRNNLNINLRKERRFNPTGEEAKQIDKWHLAPPEGEGRAIFWIAKQLNIAKNSLIKWFIRTGRPMRSMVEQNQQESTTQQRSESSLATWKEVGALKGRLESAPSRERAQTFLNAFFHRLKANIINRATYDNAYAVFEKYQKIIDNTRYPEDLIQNIPQQSHIS